MAFDMVKFERGQVWVIRYKNHEQVGHEIQKDRPWLVVSIGKFNSSSGMITCVPFSTQDAVKTPSQVMINDMRGRNSVIMCEQIRSFDCTCGAYYFDYLGSVSTDVLEKVDVALSIHLGFHYSPITLNNLYKSMESVVKSIGYMQDKAASPKFTDEDVQKFADKLKSLAGGCNNIEDTEVSEELISSHQEVASTLSKDTNETIAVKSKRISWTKETCENFMDDVINLPIKAVMEKWNISKKARFYSMKNYVQNLMTKMD